MLSIHCTYGVDEARWADMLDSQTPGCFLYNSVLYLHSLHEVHDTTLKQIVQNIIIGNEHEKHGTGHSQ